MNTMNIRNASSLRVIELQELMKSTNLRSSKKYYLKEMIHIISTKRKVYDPYVLEIIKRIEQNKIEKGLK